MKNNKLISLILALLVCFSLILTVSATTDNNLTLAVEANASTVVVSGDTIKVQVKINENTGFAYFKVVLNWDSKVLEYVGVSSSGSPYTSAGSDFVITPQPNSNKVAFSIGNPLTAVSNPSGAPKYADSGLVAEVTFKVKDSAAGEVKFNLSNLNIIYPSGDKVTDLSAIKTTVPTLSIDKPHTCASTKEATCTEAKKCDTCGKVLEEAKGHKPGAAATCTTNQTCTVCSEVLVAAAHTEVVVKGNPATCTTAGLTDGKTCSVCKAVIEEQKEIAATGHTEGKLAAKKATCTATGLTEGKECIVCKVVLVAQEAVAATGHDWSDAWTNNSSSGHWNACKNGCGEKQNFVAHTLAEGVCSVCGYGCQHKGGTATCTELAVCDTCNKPYGELLAHTPGPAATCNNEQNCTVCGAVLAETAEHVLTIVEAQAATCGAAGWDKYEKCSNCEYTTYKEIPATEEHTFGEWTVVKEATTKAPGEQTRSCSVCGVDEIQSIAVLSAPAVPVLWIVILAVLIVAVVVVFILLKKSKN